MKRQEFISAAVTMGENIDKFDRIAKILADFYRAPLSMASVQPILDLAVELNPELKTPTHVEGVSGMMKVTK